MFISVKVITNAGEDKVLDFCEKILKVKLREAPIRGRANKALVKFLSKEFDVGKKDIRIIRGEKTREKFLEVFGFEEKDLKSYLKRDN